MKDSYPIIMSTCTNRKIILRNIFEEKYFYNVKMHKIFNFSHVFLRLLDNQFTLIINKAKNNKKYTHTIVLKFNTYYITEPPIYVIKKKKN